MLFTGMLWARHPKLGHMHTHTNMMANIHKFNLFTEHQADCEVCGREHAFGIWACIPLLHGFPAACLHVLLGFMHLQVCACVLKGECLYNTYVCPYKPACDVYIAVGQQFYRWADVRISISPSCFQFQMGLNFLCPYWFIMTYFDYLSMGSHINPWHYCRGEIKRLRLK